MPDSFEFGTGSSKDEDSSSGSTVRTAAAAVNDFEVTVLAISVRRYGNLKPELGRSFADGETRFGDARQPERLLGDEEHTVPRNPREHEKIREQKSPGGLKATSLDLRQSSAEEPGDD